MVSVEALIRAPGQQTRHGLRDTTMILLLFDAAARIQEVLDLTLADVTTTAGSRQARPPQQDLGLYWHRPSHPMLNPMTNRPARATTEELPVHECWAMLRGVSGGRLAVWVTDHPDIFPVNYAVDHGTLVFRTGPGTKLAAVLSPIPVALEADGVDATSGIAWSVVAKGNAELIDSTEDVLDSFSLMLFPWQSGHKDTFIRITPTSITGRKFDVAAPAHWWTAQAGSPHASPE